MGTLSTYTKYVAFYAVSHCWPVGQANTHQEQCLDSATGQVDSQM